MNAIARNSITKHCRVVLHKRQGRRRLIPNSSAGSSGPQERSVAIAAAVSQPFSPHPSVMAKDIELLLGNIGVSISSRCSLHTIENIIQQSSSHCNEDDVDNNDAANMIDIIAQIRSI